MDDFLLNIFYPCKFCNQFTTYELKSYFTINSQVRETRVESCQNCLTPFNIAETKKPRSKHRIFKIHDDDSIFQEEFIFDDGLNLDNDYSNKISYIGKYTPSGRRINPPYHIYSVITSFELIDISKLSAEQLHKKVKLYINLL